LWRACLYITDVVKCGDGWLGLYMKAKKGKEKAVKSESGATSVRATITFPPDLHATLEQIAEQKKVSLAWVVREAAGKYIEDKWPLFKGQERP
jgi:hypothetical protein